MPWTSFMDMHSGGGLKESPYQYIFIEAPQEEACVIFYNRFGHNPNRVTCTCCGEDYSISEYPTLEQATGFERGCQWYAPKDKKGHWISHEGRFYEQAEPVPEGHEPSSSAWRKYRSLDEYIQSGEAMVIRHEDIRDEERVGELPRQGYVWMD